MKKLQILAGLALLLFLAGCVEIREEVWVNGDQSGRIKIDIGIVSEEVPTWGSKNLEEAIKEYRKNMVEGMEEKKQNIEKIPNVKSVKIQQIYDDKKGELDHYIYDVHTKDIANLDDIFQEIRRDDIDEEANWSIKTEKLENGNILFRQVFVYEEAEEDKQIRDKALEEEIAEELDLSDKKRYFSIILHTPKIISTNGEPDEWGRTAKWKVAFDDLSDDASYEKEFRAEIQLPKFKYSLVLLLVVLAISALVIAGIYVSIGKGIKRRKKNEKETLNHSS